MSYLNKEQLAPSEKKTIDDIALAEVDSYIEKVEGSTERTISDNQNQQYQAGQTQQSNQIAQRANIKTGEDNRELKKIVLPIDESLMKEGLSSKPTAGVRWLAEWCLMMIKKYPGRVFYSPTTNYD